MAKVQKFTCDGCGSERDETMAKPCPDGWRKVTVTSQGGIATAFGTQTQSVGPLDVCSEGCVMSAIAQVARNLFPPPPEMPIAVPQPAPGQIPPKK